MLERPHVVEAVRELDQEHADVARHRDEHLAEALGLPVLARREVDLAELGHAIDEKGDLFTEHRLDVGDARFAIFDDVVKQRRAHARRIEPHVGDDVRHRNRMDEVRITRLAALPVVHARGIDVGLVDQIGIRSGMVSLHLFKNIGEADHGGVLTRKPQFNTVSNWCQGCDAFGIRVKATQHAGLQDQT